MTNDPNHGDIISIGVAKNNSSVIIEYWDCMSRSEEAPTSFLNLDKSDCEKITEFSKFLKDKNDS